MVAVHEEQMSKQTESLLQAILDELKLIRQHFVKPEPEPVNEEVLTRVLGVGPDEAFNK